MPPFLTFAMSSKIKLGDLSHVFDRLVSKSLELARMIMYKWEKASPTVRQAYKQFVAIVVELIDDEVDSDEFREVALTAYRLFSGDGREEDISRTRITEKKAELQRVVGHSISNMGLQKVISITRNLVHLPGRGLVLYWAGENKPRPGRRLLSHQPGELMMQSWAGHLRIKLIHAQEGLGAGLCNGAGHLRDCPNGPGCIYFPNSPGRRTGLGRALDQAGESLGVVLGQGEQAQAGEKALEPSAWGVDEGSWAGELMMRSWARHLHIKLIHTQKAWELVCAMGPGTCEIV
ncbi:hypothetical protein Droror1_Dr00026571 [Drosera rotundifolia]